MSDKQDDKSDRPVPAGGFAREARIKANLRANLQRRKQKARALKAQDHDGQEATPQPSDQD